jgi:serine/threonine protein kinase
MIENIENYKNIKAEVFGSTHREHFEKMVEHHVSTLLHMAEKMLSEEELSSEKKIGEGRTAKVFSVGKILNCCVKIIKTQEGDPNLFRNSVTEELKLMDSYSGREIKGVMVPEPYLSIKAKIEEKDNNLSLKDNNLEMVFMQNVPGVSFADILEGKEEFPELEDFDIKKFFDKLYDFIDFLNGSNVFHRDLHEGNVMIGNDGTPWVIDFGSAIKTWGEDDAYDITSEGETTRLRTDRQSLAVVEKKVRKFLESRKSLTN